MSDRSPAIHEAEAAVELAALADRYWQAYLAFHPIAATSIGDRRFDDRLDDRTPAAIASHRDELRQLIERVEPIAPDGLDEEDRVTRSALLDQLVSDVAELDAGLDEWMVDPLEGPQIIALDLEAFQSVATPEQGAAMVRRWREMGPWIDEHAANLRRGLEGGRAAVRTPVERVIEEIRDILARPDDELPLLAPAAVDHSDWPAGEGDAFRAGLAEAVSEVVRPALGRYLAMLEAEIRPRAR